MHPTRPYKAVDAPTAESLLARALNKFPPILLKKMLRAFRINIYPDTK